MTDYQLGENRDQISVDALRRSLGESIAQIANRAADAEGRIFILLEQLDKAEAEILRLREQ